MNLLTMRAGTRLWLLLAMPLVASCVTGHQPRRSQSDVAAGPHGAAFNRAGESELSQVVERVPSESRPGYRWVRGYYHWDGVQYVWVPGRWEQLPRAARK